jgi:hypothetical protein
MKDAFIGMECLATIEPEKGPQQAYAAAYNQWKKRLDQILLEY